MGTDLQIVETDVLVVGSGIAGLAGALEIAATGTRVLLVSKAPAGKANNTILAGGGFRAATDTFGFDAHIAKTLEGGRRLNDPRLVACFVERAPEKIRELVALGLSGEFHETGFRTRSPAYIGGPNITSVLVRECRKAGVRIMDRVVVTDLISADGVCCGALGFNKVSGERFGFRAGAILLATGGAGAVYAQNDNAPGSTGDGYVLCLEAGLELIDMEFVQFYPLTYAGSGHSQMLIPPVFADCGKIINRAGEDIKEKYGLFDKPVAVVSRDRFSQAIFREVRSGNGVDGTLLLDLTNVPDSRIPLDERFKSIFRKRISYHTHPVKITPACHHTMGGVVIDPDGRTSLDGLYAAGEVVGGIHGANRMGGNALSEALVFGTVAARCAADFAASKKDCPAFEALAAETAAKRFPPADRSGSRDRYPRKQMHRLAEILWEKVGIVRSKASLKSGIREIEAILGRLDAIPTNGPQSFCRYLACRNAAITGKAIAVSALERTESRGAHYREDFLEEDPDWLCHLVVRMVNGAPAVNRSVALMRDPDQGSESNGGCC